MTNFCNFAGFIRTETPTDDSDISGRFVRVCSRSVAAASLPKGGAKRGGYLRHSTANFSVLQCEAADAAFGSYFSTLEAVAAVSVGGRSLRDREASLQQRRWWQSFSTLKGCLKQRQQRQRAKGLSEAEAAHKIFNHSLSSPPAASSSPEEEDSAAAAGFFLSPPPAASALAFLLVLDLLRARA